MPKSSQNARKAKFEDIFEKLPEEKESKKIKLGSLVFPTEQALDKQDSEIVKSNNDNTGFGYIYPTKTVTDETLKDVRDEREEEKLERDESVCISEKELTENRISEKGLLLSCASFHSCKYTKSRFFIYRQVNYTCI